MRTIREMFSPFLKIREDQYYVQSYINASPHFPELLKKKENGEYVYGETARTLDKAIKDFRALGLKKDEQLTPEQEKQWISLYRELLTKELTEWKKKEENPPAVDPINFTGVMVEQIRDNKLATVRYLGGFSKIKHYTSKNMELDMTEEELKKLEKQAAG
ncbi:MAG: hypothetical protein IJJ13_02670 [Lachnospiraceae bacterium]|nr:hypothetical protein [Lachnospiraceae bacterium]